MSAKVKFSTQVSETLRRRMRATVLALKRDDPSITMSSATEQALSQWCDAIERLHNGAQPFADPGQPLPPGRPLGSL